VDLLISTSITGLKFFGLMEALRETMHKKVNVLDVGQLENNMELLHDILKDGVKIYG
jgi:predicted nucleotidyltransferase